MVFTVRVHIYRPRETSSHQFVSSNVSAAPLYMPSSTQTPGIQWIFFFFFKYIYSYFQWHVVADQGCPGLVFPQITAINPDRNIKSNYIKALKSE